MTGKVINLRTKRKQALRDKNRKIAERNSLESGIPEALKNRQKARNLRAARALDGFKRDV